AQVRHLKLLCRPCTVVEAKLYPISLPVSRRRLGARFCRKRGDSALGAAARLPRKSSSGKGMRSGACRERGMVTATTENGIGKRKRTYERGIRSLASPAQAHGRRLSPNGGNPTLRR